MAQPVARFGKVVAEKTASKEVQALAAIVESNMQEMYSMISGASTGKLRLRHTAPDSPEDGDIVITDSGGTRYIEIYNGNTGAWESAALS